MNTANLKSYAPQARRDFLAAVTTRAQRLGISANSIAPVTVQGDLMLIGGTAYPRSMDAQRNQLIAKIKKHGFAHVMEEAAYTWFNRFMAIRYMEVHGYFAHGFRVLSNPSGGNQPEILQQAQNVAIPGLDKKRVFDLLTQGNQQEELYRTLILAQSKALGQAMPFLFDTIDTSTELLLPDGLLAPQSVVRKLVGDIPEDDWQSTEILGWLYQFYVSDEKARVDALVKQGKAVQPEDIPAKTQLFTPNWIVQFMTQNSLGRLWMDVYPDSTLKDKMPYYTAPAVQEPEVAAKLREITPSSLDPNTLTAIDPAAGSGHILLVLYDLFYEFYRERGYPPSEIPRLILSQNLYGLELDRRAAQIAGFAVLMRARRDDPTLLASPPVVNVLSIVSSYGMDVDAIADTLLAPIRSGAAIALEDGLFPELAIQPRLAEAAVGVKTEATKADIKALIELFEEADVYGSLIRLPDSLARKLPALRELVKANLGVADLDRQANARELSHLVRQAEFLAAKYTVCVANPPYLGGKARCKELKDFAEAGFPNTKSDLFAMFIERGFDFAESNGFNTMVTMQSWMFLSGYEAFRQGVVENKAICSMVHMGNGVMGIAFGTAATSIRNCRIPGLVGTYSYAEVKDLGDNNRPATFPVRGPRCTQIAQSEFKKIPGWPIAYWATETEIELFERAPTVKTLLSTREGLTTGSNERFLRLWHEVSLANIGVGLDSVEESILSRKRWFPYQKGGDYRRWYGNDQYVVNWLNDGCELKSFVDETTGRIRSHNYNGAFAFRPGLTWTAISSGLPAFRQVPKGFKFDAKGPMGFGQENTILHLLGFLNSSVATALLKMLAPTLDFKLGKVESLPAVIDKFDDGHIAIVRDLCDLHKFDWNSSEAAIGFESPRQFPSTSARTWWENRLVECEGLVDRVIELEKRNNEYAISATGLGEHISADVLNSQVSLWANPLHVFRPKKKKGDADSMEDEVEETSDLTEETGGVADASALAIKFRYKALRELLSYGIGTIMGRYSLDEPGLIYAHEGGIGFNPGRYQTFPADQDGILPVTEDDFFGEEDTANRLSRWVMTVWPNSPLDENLDFIADALGRKANETALEAIRRYLATDFYKDHLQTYKKRPIYWLFSSGKHRAFQALVYLHRYNESTLSTMRSDYVTPLFGKLSARISAAEIAAQTGSTSERKAATKRLEKLRAQQLELTEFDRRLHHYALQRVSLDLDDGVKVNYGKFSDPTIGDILANVKDITGGKDE